MADTVSATIPAQRALLLARLQTVSGLRVVLDKWPNKSPQLPAAIIGSPTITYRSEFDGHFHRSTWPITFLTGIVAKGLEAGQDLLDGFMADTGAGSPRATLADPLAGAGEDLWVEVLGWQPASDLSFDDISFVGAVLDVGITYGPDDLDLGL